MPTDFFQWSDLRISGENAYTGNDYLDPLPWQVDQQAIDIAAGILDPGPPADDLGAAYYADVFAWLTSPNPGLHPPGWIEIAGNI
jgi:hypothetical protein